VERLKLTSHQQHFTPAAHPVQNAYYQLDTWQGNGASKREANTLTGPLPHSRWRHVLYAFASTARSGLSDR